MSVPNEDVIHLRSRPWLLTWNQPQKPIRHSLRTNQGVLKDSLFVRRRGDFLWHMQQARNLILSGNRMPTQERRVMIRTQMAPLIVSLSQHPDLNMSKPKIQVFLTVLLDKFYEFTNRDPEHASIYGTVIWLVAKRLETVSCLQTPIKRSWTIV